MVWPFTKKKLESSDTYTGKWKKDMLDRWIDLEARVTSLELVDKEYKKRIRRAIPPIEDEPKDIKASVLLPE